MRTARLKIAGVLCVLGGVFSLIYGYQERASQRRLQSEGVTVQATMVDHSQMATGRGRTSYEITVDYRPGTTVADGRKQVYRKEFTVTPETYENIRMGSPVTVRFLKDDPSTSEISGNPADPGEKLAVGVGLLLIGALMCYFVFRKQPPTMG